MRRGAGANFRPGGIRSHEPDHGAGIFHFAQVAVGVRMYKIPCCSDQLNAGSGTCLSESEIMRLEEAVSPRNDRPCGDTPDTHELDQLREELNLAHQQIAALQEQRQELERAVKDLTVLASTDELTGLPNSRRFKEDLEAACAFASRQNLILSLIMLDVDDFRSYTETFGQSAGDTVLRILAGLLKRATRAYDIAARHGGGEFSLLLPSTDRFDACHIANRLRMALVTYDWPSRPITASFGITTLESRAVCPLELVDQARFALRQARYQGKDRMAHFAEITDHNAGNRAEDRNGKPSSVHSLLE
jgi:diguanylate cyclase (GGDEF)-like protein